MSDLMRALIKSLIANGVKVPVDEPVCLGGEKVSPAYNLDAIILDFSEHDKVFEDKIEELEKRIQELDIIDAMRIDEKRELKQRIAELESKNNQLTESVLRKETKIHELESKETETQSGIDTSTPIDCANSLINHLTLLEASLIMPERCVRTFDIDELEQIAEHLLVYCKHNKESE